MTAHARSEPLTVRHAGAVSTLVLASALALAATPAWAYIGDSFLSISSQPGHWNGADHKGWIRAEASDWPGRLPRMNSGSADALAGEKLFFGGPNAPKPGNPGKLIIALDKQNPDLPGLMRLCASKATIAEAGYAELSDRARPVLEIGPRPAEFPRYWEYKLKDVQIVDCPTVDGADQQALVLAFRDIEWLSYDPQRPMANRIRLTPDQLPRVAPAALTSGKAVRSYLITWIAPATDPGDEACPKLNTKPTETEVFRYMSPEDVAAIRAKNGEKGISYGSQSENRGPHKLSVASFPGIVPDPGQIEPQTTIAPGLDLDGNDGRSSPPRGIRKHGNFVAPDGRRGIDNQLLRVWGCVAGFRGKRGYNNQTPNARRADGNIVTLIQVSDIDDPQNDEAVTVSLIHAMDKPIRDNSGKIFIPNYTFRPTDDPDFTLFNVQVRGRITNGVVTTDVLPTYTFTPGQGSVTELYQARLRLEPLPDGSVKGWLGGYIDYRNHVFSGYSEGLFGFDSAAVYYSMKRNADGLYDPLTHEYHGISTAFEIDTVPAFLAPAGAAGESLAQETSAPRTTP